MWTLSTRLEAVWPCDVGLYRIRAPSIHLLIEKCEFFLG